MIATVKILCYRSKKLANGENPLMIRVCKDGKKKYLGLGLSIKPEHWDFEKNQPKRNCPNREEIQQIIFDRAKEYQEQVLEYKIAKKEFTATTLVEKVSNPVRTKTVKAVFDSYIQQLKATNKIRYADMFITTLNSLLKFNGHLDIYFPEIDLAWLRRCEAWMYKEGLAMNTLETRFVRLRALFNVALEEQIVKREYYPFGSFKVSKLKRKTAKRAILKEEVLKVLNYQGKSFYECDRVRAIHSIFQLPLIPSYCSYLLYIGNLK